MRHFGTFWHPQKVSRLLPGPTAAMRWACTSVCFLSVPSRLTLLGQLPGCGHFKKETNPRNRLFLNVLCKCHRGSFPWKSSILGVINTQFEKHSVMPNACPWMFADGAKVNCNDIRYPCWFQCQSAWISSERTSPWFMVSARRKHVWSANEMWTVDLPVSERVHSSSVKFTPMCMKREKRTKSYPSANFKNAIGQKKDLPAKWSSC